MHYTTLIGIVHLTRGYGYLPKPHELETAYEHPEIFAVRRGRVFLIDTFKG